MDNKKILIFMKEIQNVLSDDLLTPKYRKLKRKTSTEGHCYAASEALYHLIGGKEAGFVPCVASFVEDNEKFTHWWIRNGSDIYDPTASQFTEVGKEPPYNLGKGAGFLTKSPSKRAQEIINRVEFNLFDNKMSDVGSPKEFLSL